MVGGEQGNGHGGRVVLLAGEGVRVEEFAVRHGLAGLFLVSFLASTLLPLGSEWLLVLLLLRGVAPGSAVGAAALGNYLGACCTYAIGIWGSNFVVGRILRCDAASLARAEKWYKKYGSWSLLFSWLPLVGDPLCLVGGGLRINFLLFSLLVFTGKLGRYLLVTIITLASMAP